VLLNGPQNKSWKLKGKLVSKPIFKYPDFTTELILTTDASNEGVGAILSQGEIGKDLPIACASRNLNNSEKNYSTSERVLAVVCAVKHNIYIYIYIWQEIRVIRVSSKKV
jgi:hypothetical protein